jgi:hypothetical protein
MESTFVELMADLLIPRCPVLAADNAISLEVCRIKLVDRGVAGESCIGEWKGRGGIIQLVVPVPPACAGRRFGREPRQGGLVNRT